MGCAVVPGGLWTFDWKLADDPETRVIKIEVMLGVHNVAARYT